MSNIIMIIVIIIKITNIIGYLEDLKAAMRYDLKFPCKALSLS